MSVNWWTERRNKACPYNGILFSSERDQAMDTGHITNLKNTLSQRRRSQDTRDWMNSFIWSVQKRQSDGDKGDWGWWEQRLTVHGHEESHWGGENVLNWWTVRAAPLGKVPKNHWIIHTREYILQYVKYTTKPFQRKHTHTHVAHLYVFPKRLWEPHGQTPLTSSYLIISRDPWRAASTAMTNVQEMIFLKNKTKKFCVFPQLPDSPKLHNPDYSCTQSAPKHKGQRRPQSKRIHEASSHSEVTSTPLDVSWPTTYEVQCWSLLGVQKEKVVFLHFYCGLWKLLGLWVEKKEHAFSTRFIKGEGSGKLHFNLK